MRRLTLLCTAVAVKLTTYAIDARADLASAEALFDEGAKLFDEGKVAEACAKFAESQRLDPSPGTLLNLARCHRAQGKTASAWAEYLAAKRLATAQGRQPLADEAETQASALVPMLSKLTVRVESPVEGLVVKRNGEPIASASIGTALPIDPGRYTIAASAPGHVDWVKEVEVEAGADQEAVVVPALEAAAAAPADAPRAGPALTTSAPEKDAETTGGGAPVAAYVVGGAGVAVLGAGLVFGGLASSKYGDAESACPDRTGCTSDAIQARDDAGTFATVANVGVGVGLAAIGVGVVLLLMHDSGEPASGRAFSVAPVALRQGGGASFVGVF
jgi:hypothetical protein